MDPSLLPPLSRYSKEPLQQVGHDDDDANVRPNLADRGVATDDRAWPDHVRAQLGSGNVRDRLAAYAQLADACRTSRHEQQRVGQVLGATPWANSSGFLQIVLRDLHANDRIVRIASARLICCVVHENLCNQEMVMHALGNAGVTLGWLYIFSIPAFLTKDETCRYPTEQYQAERSLPETVRALVMQQSADVYRQVCDYYASGCSTTIPLCWQFPSLPSVTSDDDTASKTVGHIPDPAEYVLAFYLVPRQTHFPEPDVACSEELLAVMDREDLAKLALVKTAFDEFASIYGTTTDEDSWSEVPVDQFVQYCSTRSAVQTRLAWFLDDKCSDAISSMKEFLCLDLFEKLRPSTSESQSKVLISWGDVLVYASMRLNMVRFVECFGHEVLDEVAKFFRALMFSDPHVRNSIDEEHLVKSTAYVWEPVFTMAIQRQASLPKKFKASALRSLQRRGGDLEYLTKKTTSLLRKEGDSVVATPWQALLLIPLNEISPTSWTLFLAHWRASTVRDQEPLKPRVVNQPVSHNELQRCSTSSACQLRGSIVNRLLQQKIGGNALEQIRQEFAGVRELTTDAGDSCCVTGERPQCPDLVGSSKSHRRDEILFHEDRSNEIKRGSQSSNDSSEKEEEDDDDEEEEEDDDDNFAESASLGDDAAADTTSDSASSNITSSMDDTTLFRKMQHSMGSLDAAMQELVNRKQQEKQNMLKNVRLNQQQIEIMIARRHCQIEQKEKEKSALLAKLGELNEMGRAIRRDRVRRRHEQVARRKQTIDNSRKQQEHKLAVRLATQTCNQQQPQLQEFKQIQPKQDNTSSVKQSSTRPGAKPSPRMKRALSAHSSIKTRQSSSEKPCTEATTPPTPEVLRQRAALYGQVVSRLYRAETVTRTRPSAAVPCLQPHHVARSFSTFRVDSLNVRAPISRPAFPASVSVSPIKRYRQQSIPVSPTPPIPDPVTIPSPLHSNACKTLVMRNVAHAVSDRLEIPSVSAPAVDDTTVPPYVIAAQYAALDDVHKQNFRQRFNLKCVSHRLSFEVLQQYTKLVRRDTAWHEFQVLATSTNRGDNQIHYVDFVSLAHKLGITLRDRHLLVVARQLDPHKTGMIDWQTFYSWWAQQFNDLAQQN